VAEARAHFGNSRVKGTSAIVSRYQRTDEGTTDREDLSVGCSEL
jgi:hypothetical protein